MFASRKSKWLVFSLGMLAVASYSRASQQVQKRTPAQIEVLTAAPAHSEVLVTPSPVSPTPQANPTHSPIPFTIDKDSEVPVEVQTLDPLAAHLHTEEYQKRLSTETFQGELLKQVGEIAKVNETLRDEALANLARNDSPHAAALLFQLWPLAQIESSRAFIIESVKPKSLQSAQAQLLFLIINDTQAPDSLREKAAIQVLDRYVRETPTAKSIEDSVLTRVEPGFQVRLIELMGSR